jgi:hypothetical protein
MGNWVSNWYTEGSNINEGKCAGIHGTRISL